MKRGPKKLFYKIGEVCRICDLEAHVLRYWEREFPILSPAKNRAGQRIYREKDLQLVQEIKELLYGQRYTIAGARRRLRETAGRNLPLFSEAADWRQQALNRVQQELDEIERLLERDGLKEVQPESGAIR